MVKLTPEQRRHVIMVAAERIARHHGITAVTHGAVAKQCVVQTSKSTVKTYYCSKQALWEALLAHTDDPAIAESARDAGVQL
jgi:DNA-binding transcriptional regulator YbjK